MCKRRRGHRTGGSKMYPQETLPDGWPTAADRLPLADAAELSVREGIGALFHTAMAHAYRERRTPLSGAIHWGHHMVTVAIACEGDKWSVLTRLFRPIELQL